MKKLYSDWKSIKCGLILTFLLSATFVTAFAQTKPCAETDYDCQLIQDTKQIADDPNSSDGYFGRANTYSLKEDYKNAVKDYTKAIELMNPPNAEIYSGRASAYYELKKYDQAISDYTKAIAVDPTVADYFYYRGVAYHDKHDDEKAIADFGKTLKMDSTYTDAKDRLQEIIAEAKDEIAKQNAIIEKETSKQERVSNSKSVESSNSGLPAGTYACFTTVSIYAGRGGSGASTYPIYNSTRQTRGSIRVQSDGTYRLDDGTTLHYSFGGSAIRWLDGTFAEASSSSLQSDNLGNTQILIKFNGDKDIWDCTKQ